MYFDRADAIFKLRRQQEKLRPLFEKAGIDPAAIDKWFNYERWIIDRDAAFYWKVDDTVSPGQELPYEEDFSLGTMDELSDPQLHAALMMLSDKERDVVFLRVVDGLPLKLIADLRDDSYASIRQLYARAIKRLKNFYKKLSHFLL